ncbi:hypothetical protein MMYC01_206153 [Madurella mycetomatis]|uniref:Heterokaryon incompatibility domain-containing protein n=1 Tax=Madurella mycetomatis TaxID=100816 RepID=A0A175W074_9PEZI|nr:hypothetical protein MMYC01_206153 [Madurella mycetomatis]
MICARCRHALQCIVSNDDTWTTGSKPVEREQLHGDRSCEQEELGGWHTFTHHPTYESLREAIDQRCSVCIVLWETLEPEQQVLFMDATRPHKDSTSATTFEAFTTFQSTERQMLREDARKHPSVLSDHTRSSETLALAKRWITDCVRRHEKCKAVSGDGTWYPSRLLDLTRVNGTEPPSEQIVCLIETAKVTPAGRYTTVSHRWGPTEQLQLTRHTYPQLAEGILLRSLPQLMQDVIFVSLELGIRYTWIDLLCIYQDEDNIVDWQRESTLMNQVYSNTFCNISAGDANGCLESLFRPRDTDTFLPQVIELKIGHHDGETQLFRIYDDSYWHRNVSRALVNKRAWVLQERFLSPRVLQFDKHQVLWECIEKSATETCPNRIPNQLLGRGHVIFKNLVPVVQTTRVLDSRFLGHVRLLWTCLVKEYTACGLTIPSDKLIAISGVAKYVAALLQGDYVAGMWRSHLEGELLWYVIQSGLPGKTSRPAQYRAPSWSWASIDGPVQPGWSSVSHSLIKVEEVHLEYLTGDVFGAVTRGWLRLRGALKQLQLVRNSLSSGGRWEWDIILEGVKVTAPGISMGSILAYPTSPELRLDVFQEDFEEENTNDMLFAMLARDIILPPCKFLERDRRLEILLLKLIDREKAIFERIGVAKVGNSAAEEILKMQRPANAPALPCLEYRDGMHSICII